jgi:hypothetical protein
MWIKVEGMSVIFYFRNASVVISWGELYIVKKICMFP